MTSKNIRIYEIEASGKPQKLIKILSAESPAIMKKLLISRANGLDTEYLEM